MKCLNCGQEMANNLVLTKGDQIAYDICEACGSLWLDAGELDKMAFQVEGSVEFSSTREAEDGAQPGRDCPRCDDEPLRKVAFIGYSGILLDHCPNCGGFWLDGGELDLMNRELESIMPVTGKGFSEFVNNVHLPYWHKRLRRESGQTDFTVEVPPIRDAHFRAETPYVCPGCGARLNRYGVYGIDVEGCPQCKGLWCDPGELRKLKDRGERGSWRSLRWMDDEIDAIAKANAVPSKRACPKCDDARLLSTSFGDSNIIIDWCPSCQGTWLERHEFEEIVNLLKDRLAHMSAEELKGKVYEEIREIWDGPEDKVSEILDAKAAISAFINVTVFEHPGLYRLLSAFSRAAHAVGI